MDISSFSPCKNKALLWFTQRATSRILLNCNFKNTIVKINTMYISSPMFFL